MAYPPIANINVSLEATAVSVAGFGTPLFLTSHRAFVERVRTYSDLEEVAEDFDVTDNAYKAAQAFFAPTPKPNAFKVGRVQADALFDVVGVAEDVEFIIEIGVNENTVAPISYTALAADDEEAVVDALVTAIDGIYSANITASKVGSGATSQLSIVPVTEDDNFVLGTLTNVTVAYTASETAVEAKQACASVDPDFYWTTSEFKDQTNVLALAAETEAEERHYMSSLADTDILASIVEPLTDTYAKLEDAGYERSSGLFHDQSDSFPELGVIGKFSVYEPGTIDWYAKVINGFGTSKNPTTGVSLTTTELTYLSDRKVNYIVEEGGVNIYKRGLTFSNNTLLDIVFRDFYAARLREAYQLWRINNKRIPYTQKGIDAAENVCVATTTQYVSTDEQPHAISSFRPNFPLRENVPQADVLANTLNASITVYLAGSIFTVNLNATLTYQ